MFVATFSDGYIRKIYAHSIGEASRYARDLESWFISIGENNRILLNVEHTKRRA